MDIKKLLSLIGVAVVVLIMIAFAAVWIGFHRGEQGGQQNGNSSAGGNCSILFPISAGTDEQIGKVIDKWVDQYAPQNSPLKGKGKLFAQSGRESKVNPALIAAIARKESSFGTAGIALNGSHNPFGRRASASQPDIDGWYKFDSWDAAILDEGPYINRVYTSQGLTTVGQFINKYAPPSENNTTKYIEEITNYMNEMARMGNGVVLGPECAGKWIWPIDNHSNITSRFGETGPSHSRPHTGLDIAVPRGTPIKAVDNGTVTVVNTNPNDITGIYVKINHGDGMESIYGHMIEGSPTVSVGDSIRQGQTIGQVDSTGHSTGNHLHLGAKLNGSFVNPLNYLP